jgi:molybdopterin converting factor small subunit
MSVKINLHPNLYQFTNGQAVVAVEGRTVGECVNQLVKRFPRVKSMLLDKSGNLLNYVDVYVNGESSYPEELAKPVKDGDEIHITLIIAGG